MAKLCLERKMQRLLQLFETTNHPEDIKKISEPFKHLATHLKSTLKEDVELIKVLRKLLETKNIAVETALNKGVR